jgi:hypothetical protein
VVEKEPKAMEEIHAIRRKLHEEEAKLSLRERVQRANRATQQFLKQRGLEDRWVPATQRKASTA